MTSSCFFAILTTHMSSGNNHRAKDSLALYEKMLCIRRFEETVLDNFNKGIFFGTTHTCIGQEANAVGVIQALDYNDIVVSNHRSHGHFIAYGGSEYALFAELMGKSTGVCGGWGGSQHLHWQNFYANGVQGGMIPNAVGMALAEKRKHTSVITTAFLGDGTLGEGVIYEAFNMAGLWQAPILFVVEDNHIAQTTPTIQALAGNMNARFQAFGIEVQEVDTSDVEVILDVTGCLTDEIRSKSAPWALIIHTCRFAPHSKGDDTRPQEEVKVMRVERDPLRIQADRLEISKIHDVETKVEEEIFEAFNRASMDPVAELERVEA